MTAVDSSAFDEVREDLLGERDVPDTKKPRRMVIRDPGLRALAEFVQVLDKQTPLQRDATVRWLAAFYKVIV